jgi:hypothetical protein
MGDFRTAELRREAGVYRARAERAVGERRAELLARAERRDREADERDADKAMRARHDPSCPAARGYRRVCTCKGV